MQRDRYLSVSCETFGLQRLFEQLPQDYPSRRDVLIQTNKLERLLKGRLTKAERLRLGSGSLEKFNQELGRYDAQCGKQHRLVRAMVKASMKEWVRRKMKDDGVPFTRKAFESIYKEFDREVNAQVQKIMKPLIARRKNSLLQAALNHEASKQA
jgi:hypothetical protein